MIKQQHFTQQLRVGSVFKHGPVIQKDSSALHTSQDVIDISPNKAGQQIQRKFFS